MQNGQFFAAGSHVQEIARRNSRAPSSSPPPSVFCFLLEPIVDVGVDGGVVHVADLAERPLRRPECSGPKPELIVSPGVSEPEDARMCLNVPGASLQ